MNKELRTDIGIGLGDGMIIALAIATGMSAVIDSSGIIVLTVMIAIVAGAVYMGLGGYFTGKSELRLHYKEPGNTSHSSATASIDKERIRSLMSSIELGEALQKEAAEELLEEKTKWSEYMRKHGFSKQDAHQITRSAFTIGFAYLLGGLIAISPYFFIISSNTAMKISLTATILLLFVFGYTRSAYSGTNPWLGALRLVLLGAFAAGSAYGVAMLFQ
jgi:vacuolar iron transporter family protein